jgi:hypothetical protein
VLSARDGRLSVRRDRGGNGTLPQRLPRYRLEPEGSFLCVSAPLLSRQNKTTPMTRFPCDG